LVVAVVSLTMSYIIFDLEATCWNDGSYGRDQMETIEIGALKLNSRRGLIESEFSTFVQPVATHPLSDFCRNLTSIRQKDVDEAPQFPDVFPRFVEWCGPEPFFLCSWGNYDFGQLRQDCARHKLEFPLASDQHINLKIEFARTFDTKPCGMEKALRRLEIPLVGTHHRGIDDARNITEIALILWADLD